MKQKIFLQKTFFFLFIVSIVFQLPAFSQVNIVTQHNDLARTGWNNNETILNTRNVKAGSFGMLFSRTVDDQLYAQLLIMHDVAIPSVGNRNVIFAATVNNSVYAFDADSVGISNPYWHVNLTQTGLRAPKNSDMTGACGGGYADFSGNIGIVGTPVIDSATNTLYVVARSVGIGGTGFVQYLHALDITTGNERANSPKLITAQATGSGAGSTNNIISFDAQHENQRCGLLLLNGIIYITYASHCDWGPYHGWILGYNKTTLAQTTVYNDTPSGYNGGIWMSGAAPAADSAGNIYVAVGNGSAGLNGDITNTINRSESAVKLVPSANALTLSTYFTPKNYSTLEAGDLDFGDAQMMLLPNTNQVITACKDGTLYLLDRDNMGGYSSSANNVLQSFSSGANAHNHASFSYYGGAQKKYIYFWSENALLKAFPYNISTGKLDVGNVINSGVQGPVGNSGAFLSVSSNGSVDSTAILWATFASNGDANQSVRPGILYAFNATDVTKVLWNSSMVAKDNPGNYAKFNNPTIANGKVYLATFSNSFIVYGLAINSADTCNSTNLALNKMAVASSIQSSSYPASYAVDGNTATRWASNPGVDPQYIYVDLGQSYDLCSVLLVWENAYGKDFTIDVSQDASAWTTIQTITGNVSLNNYLQLQGRGRYVRMRGTARGTTSGYSLYEFQVFGTPTPSLDCVVPDSLSNSDIFENTATLHWKSTGAANYNIQYKAVISSNWITVSSDTNMVVLTDLSCGTDYLFKVQSACSSTDTSLYSPTSSFSQLACGSNCDPLPTRWTTQDIGNTDIPGSACYDPDVFTLNGSGNDIGGTADAFRFANKTLVGDGEFDARVLTMDSSSTLNKCGIMIRETLASGSKYAFIGLTSGNGAIFQTRNTTDGNTSVSNSASGIVPPYYVRLIKSGSTYTALISSNGISYTSVGSSVDVGFGNNEPVYAGLALTSHNNAILSTATIDKYAFTSGVLPVKLLSFNATLNLSNKVDLRWSTTQEMNTNHFVIERSSSDYHYKAIDSVKAINNGAFTTTYNKTDNAPLNGINFYRLKIVDADGNYTYSALSMVRNNAEKAPLIYPNPAKTVINIARGSDVIRHITIYDVSGRAVVKLRNLPSGNVTQISTANLLRGTYFVEITTEADTYKEKLLIQ